MHRENSACFGEFRDDSEMPARKLTNAPGNWEISCLLMIAVQAECDLFEK